jgi:hypothetical protein
MWEGEDVYIIGGGTSLKTFDFNRLLNKNTIGCNSAFALGGDICDVCVFGDWKWWRHFGKKLLETFPGMIITNSPRVGRINHDRVFAMRRQTRGLSTDRLGWNRNTGALAINVALLLGAKRIYLLGYDMKLGTEGEREGKANWHDLRYEKEKPGVYKRFQQGFENVVRDWKAMFPDREIINLTEDSELVGFPKESIVAHFSMKGEEKVCLRAK